MDSALVPVLALIQRAPLKESYRRWHVQVTVLLIQSPLKIFCVLATEGRHFCRLWLVPGVSSGVSFAGPGF